MRVPLGHDPYGEPLDLPETAVAWRVRRAPAKGQAGRPAVLYDDRGQPLTVAIGATAEDLADAAGGGRFRLDAIDAAGAALLDEDGRGLTAVTEIGGLIMGGPSAEPTDDREDLLRRLVDRMGNLAEKLTETNCRISEAMARGYGPVRPTREEPAPSPAVIEVPQAPPPPVEEQPPQNFAAIVGQLAQLGPLLIPVLQQLGPILGPLFAKWAGGTAAAAPVEGAPVNGVHQHGGA
jgi:hypothetical protein